MWIKFDGKKTYIKINNFDGKEAIVETEAIVLGQWVNITNHEGNIFVNGKKVEEINNNVKKEKK